MYRKFIIGDVELYFYGLFYGLGWLLAILVIARYFAKKDGISPQKITMLGWWAVLAATFGGKLLWIFVNYYLYKDDPLRLFKIWDTGIVFYGGFVGACLMTVWYTKVNNMNLWETLDTSTPAILFGHGVGRIGCFLNGCCYGTETDLPWGVVFPDEHINGGVSLHPTQLYSSFNLFLLFAFMVFFRRYKKFHGHIFWLYVVLYSVNRFLLEFLRGDDRGHFIFASLSTSQTVGMIMFVVGIFMLNYLKRPAMSALKATA